MKEKETRWDMLTHLEEKAIDRNSQKIFNIFKV